MKYDFTDLSARILDRFENYRAFAKAAGISPEQLRRYLQNARPMKVSVMNRMVELLQIPDIQVDFYFFRRLQE